MNKMRNQALLLLLAMLSLATFTTSCESEDEPETSIEVGETVKDFVKVTQYEDSKTFQTDVDELVTYALAQRAFRWGYIYFASKGLYDGELFATTPDDWANDSYCNSVAELLYDMINYFAEHETEYSESIQRLEDSGVLTKTNDTRGIGSDVTEFFLSCKKTQVMGRKSVVSVIRQLGWSTNAAKMKQLYDDLPSDLRRGYSNYTKFWEDFSAGNLDARANQVFVNLYNYADMDFGEKCREIGTTPGGNITVAGADLIEKGLSLVIDACPISGEIGYGKDIFGAVEAANGLVSKGDVKGFLKNAAGNLVNYGREGYKLANKLQGIDKIYWADADDLWDAFGKDITTIYTNDILFDQEFENAFDRGEGERFVPQLVRTKDANGQEITLVIMTDEASGQKIIGCVLDKDGNIITNPRIPGQKTITVLDRFTGKRLTKKVKVPADGDVDVEVDLKHYERELEEIPKNGDLRLQKNPLTDEGYGGSYKILIDTNYLYYTCEKDTSSWISARVGTDINYLYVTVTKNNTGKERIGHVTVAATDSKGKVLKTTVLTVKQQAIPEEEKESITLKPSTLVFDGEGGSQVITAYMPSGQSEWQAVANDDCIGWAKVEPYADGVDYKIKVTVNPNNTGKDRSGTGTVSVYERKDSKKASFTATFIIKQTAIQEGAFGEQIIGKWYNAPKSPANIDNVCGFEFTKDGKYTWYDYWVKGTSNSTKLTIVKPEDAKLITGTYSVSGNKITFKPSSGSYSWGYNSEKTFVIELSPGKDVEFSAKEKFSYSGKILQLKKTDGNVPDTYNWKYYKDLWTLDKEQNTSVKINEVNIVAYVKTDTKKNGSGAFDWIESSAINVKDFNYTNKDNDIVHVKGTYNGIIQNQYVFDRDNTKQNLTVEFDLKNASQGPYYWEIANLTVENNVTFNSGNSNNYKSTISIKVPTFKQDSWYSVNMNRYNSGSTNISYSAKLEGKYNNNSYSITESLVEDKSNNIQVDIHYER
jgi:hypothetical protein